MRYISVRSRLWRMMCMYVCVYIVSVIRFSLSSFIQQRTTIFIIFRSSSSFSPSSHFFVWMQISSLRYCFPWSLPLYSAVSPRLLFHSCVCAHAYIRVCLCPYFRRMYRCILSNVSLVFPEFSIFYPVSPFSCNLLSF